MDTGRAGVLTREWIDRPRRNRLSYLGSAVQRIGIGARMGKKELNNPPVDLTHNKVGMFPKSSHQLDALKKKLPDEQIKDTEDQVKDIKSEGKEEDKDEANVEIESHETSETGAPKRQRIGSDNETEGPNPAKRNKSDNTAETSQTVATDKNMEKNTDKNTEKNTDTNTDKNADKNTDKTTPGGKKKSRKRKSRSKTCETTPQDSDVIKSDSELDKSVDAVPEKKAKLDDQSSETVPEKKAKLVESEKEKSDANDKENNAKKDKKRVRRKKPKKEKEVPELRVIPKSEWLKLREEYLDLQKTNMKMLKQTLHKKSEIQAKEAEDKKKKKEIQFTPNVIVKVVSEEGITRKKLKESFKEDVKVAYIDLTDGLSEAYVRCQDADSASKLLNTSLDGVTFTQLLGEDEKQYWDKLTSDRETKLNTKCRSKKRGHQKLMDKAQKAVLDTTEKRQHIVFEDD